MKKENIIIFLFVFVSILFISVSYAVFNTNLYVSGSGVFRAHANVRIIGLRNSGYYGEAIENYNPNYNIDVTNMGVNLPTSDSSVTYEVTIKNYGNEIFISQIEVLSELSNNVNISITDGTTNYNLPNNNMNYKLEANEEKTYTLTISNKPGTTNNDVVVNLKYHFVVDEVLSPIIALSLDEQSIELVSAGTSTFNVNNYEYFVSETGITPTENITPTGTTNGTLNLFGINFGHYYVWYRTISNKGTKSSWSNRVEVYKKVIVTLNANGGTIPVTSGWTNGSGNTISTKTFHYGDLYGTLPEPSKTNAQFNGWEDEEHNIITSSSTISKINNHYLTAKWIESGYKATTLTCTGNNIENTGIYLWNNDNWQKNFVMKFELINDTSTDTMATPMSSKKEYETPWPGFEFRHSGSLSLFRSKAAKSSTSSNEIKNIKANTKFIKYLRIDNILYYSFDNANWTEMLDFSGFDLQFNIPTTFCASYDANSNPQRYFKGTISDILLTFIDDNATLSDYTNFIINFDNQGATTAGTTSTNVTFGSAMPSITLPTKTNYVFAGYYTGTNGTGTKYYNADGTSVRNCGLLPGETLYAKWAEDAGVARITKDNSYYNTLQAAITAAKNYNEQVTIQLLDDITSENVVVAANANIILDLNNYTMSNTSGILIDNKGTLEIRNGNLLRSGLNDSKRVIVNQSGATLNITSGDIKSECYQVIQNNGTLNITGGKVWALGSVDQGIINNENGGTLTISGGQVIGGRRQAIYNNGGTTTVSGTTYLENGITYTATRSCLQNASGTMYILGGTIVTGSTNTDYGAVENNGTMIIGTNNGNIDTASPVLQSTTYGLIIKSGKTVEYYDGIIKGISGAINEESRLVLDTANNVGLVRNTETIGTNTYYTVTLGVQ